MYFLEAVMYILLITLIILDKKSEQSLNLNKLYEEEWSRERRKKKYGKTH